MTNLNEPYMSLQTWIQNNCPVGIWTTIVRQEDFAKLDDNTPNTLASLCIKAIKNYSEGKSFECRSIFRLEFINNYYDFTFNDYPFSATKTRGYINGDLVDVIQVGTTFRILSE